MNDKKICIIGGGLVGLATAWQLRRLAPQWAVTLLEKEPDFGRHQSTHNSGVLHAGLYYKPGSVKARMAVSGIRLMTEFCRARGVAHEICGKLVVATDDAEVGRLKTLLERGTQNGLSGLRWLNLLLAVWLIAAPWILHFDNNATINSTLVGIALAGLSLVRGRTTERYGGGWSMLWRTT